MGKALHRIYTKRKPIEGPCILKISSREKARDFLLTLNIERVRKLTKTRRNNIITASLLGVGVISIYAYSILSVKQEKFLDEID
ncbi:cytochrome c oxidase assembly factor 3, mitochondrial [Armadillidium vulgare]|nr:cytochrome c oxidase assembly factor 3, mitochondrial [Armadillidium vulgare]